MKKTPTTDANKEVWFYGKDKTKEMYEIFSYDPQKVKIFSIVMVNPFSRPYHFTHFRSTMKSVFFVKPTRTRLKIKCKSFCV